MIDVSTKVASVAQDDFKAPPIKPMSEMSLADKASSFDTQMINQQAMNQILANMKEVYKLPSEEVEEQDINYLDRVEMPESGGTFTYFKDKFKNPYKGFPYFEFVEKLDTLKKIGRASVSGLYHSIKGNKFKLIFLIPACFLAKDIVYTQLNVFHRVISRFKIKPYRYCRSVREIHRAFSVIRPNEDKKTAEIREMMRDFVCMFLEFDNAYRFRVQDLAAQTSVERFKKGITQELRRLLNIMQAQERKQELKDTWTLLKLAIFLLWFDKKLRKMLQDVLTNINYKELELDEGDIEFCIPRKDYNFLHPQIPRK